MSQQRNAEVNRTCGESASEDAKIASSMHSSYHTSLPKLKQSSDMTLVSRYGLKLDVNTSYHPQGYMR